MTHQLNAQELSVAAYLAETQSTAEFHLLAGIQGLTEDVAQLQQQPHSAAAKLAVTERARELAAETAERLQREDPAAAIDVSVVVALLLNLPPSSVQEQLRELRQRVDFLYQMQQEASGRPGAAGGSSEAASAPSASTIFDVCMTIARLAFATAIGSLLGGPVIALALDEPLFNKAFEGAVGGLLGGLTSELNESGTAWANCLRVERQQTARQDRDDRR